MLWKRIIGITLIFAGFIAIFVPVIPGSIIIFLGLEIAGFALLKDKLVMIKTLTKKYFTRSTNT